MSRKLRLLAALAMFAVIGAGCSNAPAKSSTGGSTGSTGTSGGGGNTSSDSREQAVKFAECMRDNGVREFPDPGASGELTIDGIANGSSLDPSTAAFKQAISACKDLEPSGFTGHKRNAQQQQAALKFAQCIRDNGVADFADPDPNGPLLDVDGSKPGLKAALDAAMQKCRDFSAAAGVTGGR
jgi:hypothetical protein